MTKQPKNEPQKELKESKFDSTSSKPTEVSKTFTPRFSSSGYEPNMSIFPDPGPPPDGSDIKALAKWMLGPPMEEWTEEQTAITMRDLSLHHYGTPNRSYLPFLFSIAIIRT